MGLDVASVAEMPQIVVGPVQIVIVVEQIPPKHVYLVQQSSRSTLPQLGKQLQSLNTNEDSFGLQILASDGC